MPRQSSLTSQEIAQFLREHEIDSDPEYDRRKTEQLASAFAYRLFPGTSKAAHDDRAWFLAEALGEDVKS